MPPLSFVLKRSTFRLFSRADPRSIWVRAIIRAGALLLNLVASDILQVNLDKLAFLAERGISGVRDQYASPIFCANHAKQVVPLSSVFLDDPQLSSYKP